MPSSLILAIFLISLSHILISEAALINLSKESEMVKETASIVDLRPVHEPPERSSGHDCLCGRIRKRSFLMGCLKCPPVHEAPPMKVSTHWTDGEPTGPEKEEHERKWRQAQAQQKAKKEEAARKRAQRQRRKPAPQIHQSGTMSDLPYLSPSQASEKSSTPLLKNQ